MYIVYTDVQNYLNDTLTANGIVVVNSLIPAVEAFVDKYCSRTWKNADTDIVETFDGNTDVFIPSQLPIASVTSITIDGFPVSNFYAYKSYIKFTDKVISDMQGVVITYKSEATAIPADVKQAIIQWVAQMFQESEDAGRSTDLALVEGVRMQYKAQGDMPDFVKLVLDRYIIYAL